MTQTDIRALRFADLTPLKHMIAALARHHGDTARICEQTGDLYDALLAAQADLARGETGFDKPMSCSAAQLAKVAQLHPADQSDLTRLLGERKAERFGPAFLDVLRQAG